MEGFLASVTWVKRKSYRSKESTGHGVDDRVTVKSEKDVFEARRREATRSDNGSLVSMLWKRTLTGLYKRADATDSEIGFPSQDGSVDRQSSTTDPFPLSITMYGKHPPKSPYPGILVWSPN